MGVEILDWKRGPLAEVQSLVLAEMLSPLDSNVAAFQVQSARAYLVPSRKYLAQQMTRRKRKVAARNMQIRSVNPAHRRSRHRPRVLRNKRQQYAAACIQEQRAVERPMS